MKGLSAHIWSPQYGRAQPDMACCRAACSDGDGRITNFWQCTRPPKVERELEHPKGKFSFCLQHDPVRVAERAAKRDAKWQAEWDARDAAGARREAFREAREECIAALRAIEAGDNDPRARAREALAKLDGIGG